MTQSRYGYSSKFSTGKEPQPEAISVWSGAEPEDRGDGKTAAGERSMGEYWLWQAVVAQALQDVASCSNDRKMKPIRSEANAWFSLENEDFLFVCELAGLCPQQVLERSKEVRSSVHEGSGCVLREHLLTKKRWKWLGHKKQELVSKNLMNVRKKAAR